MALHNSIMTTSLRAALAIAVLTGMTAHSASSVAQRPAAALEPVRVALRTKNFNAAMTQLLQLSEADDANVRAQSEYLLGTLYRAGLTNDPSNMQDNETRAMQWLAKAAAHGHADAAYALAALLAARNAADPQIAPLLQSAANQGHALAQQALNMGLQPLQFRPDQSLTDTDARFTALLRAAREDDVTLLELLADQSLRDKQDDFGRSVLSHAAQAGAARTTAALLRAGAPAQQTDRFQQTPLMLAAANGHEAVVQMLISAGALPDTQDQARNTALMYAAARNHVSVVQSLLQTGADPKAINAQGWSALDWAVHQRAEQTAALLRSKGLTPSRKAAAVSETITVPLQHAATGDLYRGWPDMLIAASRSSTDMLASVQKAAGNTTQNLNTSLGPNGETPLMVAVQANNTAVVEKLLAGGASLKVMSNTRESPLSWAVRHQQVEMAQLLLNKGADPDAHGNTEAAPLLDAVRIAHETLTTALLKAGAKATASDAQNRSALMLAAQQNASGVLGLLLRNTPNSNAADKQGRSALWYAAAAGADESVALLITGKADLNQADRNGTTPLMQAASAGHEQVVSQLLAAGANVGGNTDSNTALMRAAANGHVAIVSRLLKAGSKVDQQNRFGESALMIATRHAQPDAAKLLLAAGASADLRNADRTSARDIAERLQLKNLQSLLARQ